MSICDVHQPAESAASAHGPLLAVSAVTLVVLGVALTTTQAYLVLCTVCVTITIYRYPAG